MELYILTVTCISSDPGANGEVESYAFKSREAARAKLNKIAENEMKEEEAFGRDVSEIYRTENYAFIGWDFNTEGLKLDITKVELIDNNMF